MRAANRQARAKMWAVVALPIFLALYGAALFLIWSWSSSPAHVVSGRLSPPSGPRASVDPFDREKVTGLLIADSRYAQGALDLENVETWWPPHVTNAARMYQCAPAASRTQDDSVIVWTDVRNRVVAYGAPIQGQPTPPYAAELADTYGQIHGHLVHASAQGFRVAVDQKRYALVMAGHRLSCVQTKDE